MLAGVAAHHFGVCIRTLTLALALRGRSVVGKVLLLPYLQPAARL